MGSLLVVTGPPGAGKSTVARALAHAAGRSILVEGDAFFGFLAAGGIDPWLPESDAQNTIVTRAAAAATGAFVDGGYETYYDGVLGPWFLPAFLTATGLARLDYAVLLPSEGECVRRVLTRADHAFGDEAATRHMHAQFAAADLDHRHVLSGDTADVEALAAEVHARRAAGTLTVVA